MNGPLPTGLLICAAVSTLYATITWAADMVIDFQVSALTAAVCLCAFLVIRVADRRARHRCAVYRSAVWRRRERHAYGAVVPPYPDSVPLDGKPYRHLTVIDGATVCIPKIAPALGAEDVAAIRAALRVMRDV